MRFASILLVGILAGACATTQKPEDTDVYLIDIVTKHCKVPELKAYFKFDSARVDRTNHNSLDALAQCLIEGPLSQADIELVGHADPIGPNQYNDDLSLKRAREVARYLNGRGVPEVRIKVRAAGEDDRADDHKLARRVDIKLIDCTIDPAKKCVED